MDLCFANFSLFRLCFWRVSCSVFFFQLLQSNSEIHIFRWKRSQLWRVTHTRWMTTTAVRLLTKSWARLRRKRQHTHQVLLGLQWWVHWRLSLKLSSIRCEYINCHVHFAVLYLLLLFFIFLSHTIPLELKDMNSLQSFTFWRKRESAFLPLFTMRNTFTS